MIKKYLNHMKSREPHERRQHAMQVASIFTALIFTVWLTTLGMRLGNGSMPVATDTTNTNGQTSLTASANQSEVDPNTPQLQVSTTSVYSQ